MATRESVLDSAEKCFRSFGVSHTTMTTIAERAGWSRGAVYHHFTTKSDVVNGVLGRVELSLADELRGVVNSPAPVMPTLHQCLRRYLQKIQGSDRARNAYGILAWAYDFADDCADIRERLQGEARDVLRLLRNALERAHRAGELREGVTGSRGAELIAAALLGSIGWYVTTQPNQGDSEHSPLIVLDTLVDLITGSTWANGFAPPTSGEWGKPA